MIVSFWAVGGVGFAQRSVAAHGYQYQYDTKITICHHKPGGRRVTMKVSPSELPAHLAHGDTLGPCSAAP
jgi:hypothetical protein